MSTAALGFPSSSGASVVFADLTAFAGFAATAEDGPQAAKAKRPSTLNKTTTFLPILFILNLLVFFHDVQTLFTLISEQVQILNNGTAHPGQAVFDRVQIDSISADFTAKEPSARPSAAPILSSSMAFCV
jgi:hypothetical protein